ncbi:MAG: hypothetical protein RL071_3890 [Pseudomonadota bacterium]
MRVRRPLSAPSGPLVAALAPLLVGLGCAPDQQLAALRGAGAARADLRLSPALLQLDPVAAGDSALGELLLENSGELVVSIDDLRIEGAGFRAPGPLPAALGPGEALALQVVATPPGGPQRGQLEVWAAGAAAPLRAELRATGLVPGLELWPDPIDLGLAPAGCAAEGELWVENSGELPLLIEVEGVVGAGFSVEAPGAGGPLSLEPGEAQALAVRFGPGAAGPAEGALHLRASPGGAHALPIFATAAPRVALREAWVQDGPWPEVDLLLVADRSGSMEDDLRALGASAAALLDELGARSPGAQVSVLTRDDGCLSAGPASPADPEARAALAAGLLGPWGAYTEAGFTLAARAVAAARPGGCAEGLWREDARHVVVFIADEEEQSPGGWAAGWAALRAAAPELEVFAVVGPAGGCPSAAPGEGYLQAAADSGGPAWSICGAEWERLAAELGAAAGGLGADRRALAAPARPGSVEVWVDGAPWHGWWFSAEENAVLFGEGAWPPPGAEVEVRYERAEACDRPDAGGAAG